MVPALTVSGLVASGAVVAGLELPGLVAPANAAERGWSATGCGDEPTAPTLDVSTVQHYNASVDQVDAYEKAARTYNACVTRAALKDETAISDEARQKIAYVHDSSAAIQARIASNFTRLTTALKTAGAKLQKDTP
ncbi:hypothetical protein K2X14_13410 [Acetobacter sp. TBRC 12305]|uniref:Uncharacterized protein n=2 Tax=Acetobacter garciniae TaxID=2817435 RepID=A0A939HQS3_9PROT|nr:hypothetical protein [Acetobacter garciniae]MBX0345839.1 hypothetical protein [Acetobacter garciniae]